MLPRLASAILLGTPVASVFSEGIIWDILRFRKEVPMQRSRITSLVVAAMLAVAVPALAGANGPPDTGQYTVRAGTLITVQMIDSVDSAHSRPGDEFAGTIAEPVVVGDRVVIPKGAEAQLRLMEVKSAGHIKGQSELELELTGLTLDGQAIPVDTTVYTEKGSSRGKHSAKVIGGGAGLGALIGAVAGGGRGAAIGAAVGAGAGTAVEATTRGQQVKVPSEAKVEFRLRKAITVSE
jgi:hypothetical protein